MRSRSQGRRVLEVIVFLGDDVLSHHALARDQALSIGPTAACDVVVPESFVAHPSTLVTSDGDNAHLCLPPAASALLTNGVGHSREFRGAAALTVAADCDCTMEFGPLRLRIRHIDAAERVPTRGAFAWASHKGTAVSAVAHLLVFGLVMAVPPDGFALTTDSFGRDPRLLPFRVRPMKEEIPAWLNRSKGGKASRADKGPPGKAGDRKARNKRGRMAVKGNDHKTQPVGPIDVSTMGALGVMKSSKAVALLLDPNETALGADAEQAMGNLMGDTPGPGYGVDGLDIVGDAVGARATCDGPPEDCGLVGTGARLDTRGMAPSGRTAGPLLRAKHRPGVPRVFALKAKVKGSLSKEIIRRVIRQHINEVRHCYSNALLDRPSLGGRLVVAFVIAGNGSVALSRVSDSTLGHKEAEGCVSGAVRRWQFPAPEGGGIVQVKYPFVFHAPNR